ncbi:MAG: tasA [Paenibacillaceae bacterium]|jgi:spore coat-associated protein N|nr:tasA [Paenibacillaceae bacterium]
MGIKQQLVLGVVTAALGFTLVGGGTYAYFNDVQTTTNTFATGTLKLNIKEALNGTPFTFSMGNMKPGDSVERSILLENKGSIAIKEVLFSFIEPVAKKDNAVLDENTLHDFLSQFQVESISLEPKNGVGVPKELLDPNQKMTLLDLNMKNPENIKAKLSDPAHAIGGRINLATTYANNYDGIPIKPTDTDKVNIRIKFVDEGNQNRFQGVYMDFKFHFEATQWSGIKVRPTDPNGQVNNKPDHSADSNDQQPPVRVVTGN